MIRAQSTHSPGHITTVGIGTYMDPDIAGGAANESAKKSEFHPKLISKITIDGDTHLMYRAIPIKVAIIRGTTADVQGNITMEHESLVSCIRAGSESKGGMGAEIEQSFLFCSMGSLQFHHAFFCLLFPPLQLVDQRITATAAKNSGGIVIAQVKRIAANGSFHPRDVVVPGSLVDAIVVVDPEDHNEMHPMSYMQLYNPAYTGEVRTPVDEVAPLELDERKVIARRAFFFLQPDKIVNLGIGLPEGVASVAAEEGMLEYVTLTTEPGVFGGLPAGGHNFGPSINPGAHVEMNQMFDFYDGGGLDICFLGAAQIGKNGDVNVSRMSKERLTGPGGFIDISQSTKNICFLSPLTTKGLELSFPGDGTLKIEEEGKVKKFVDKVFEITFSGEEAVRRGQTVHYITDRAVFRKTAQHDVLELVEIAPGIDLQKDVLDQLEFTPIVSDELKLMDSRIFKDQVMETVTEMFGSLKERCHYNEAEHKLFLDLFGVNLNSESDVKWFYSTLHSILDPILMKKGKFDTVINYNGFNLRKGLDDMYAENAQKTQDRFFKTVKRFTGKAFYHARMGQALKMNNLDPNELFDECDTSKTGSLTVEQVRKFVQEKFQMNLSARQLQKFQRSEAGRVTREDFVAGLDEFIG